MEAKNIVKRYKKGELTVIWEPKKCIHSGVCVKQLPKVYNPKARPWMNLDNASISELKDQIDKCPSAALSYEDSSADATDEVENIKVELMQNGPLLMKGDVEIKFADGQKVVKEKMVAFCRCGASKNKPYCDGNHKAAGFEG